jgi:hypothetical protein
MAAILAVVLPATTASAAVRSAAGTRVGAHHPVLILAVGFSQPVSPGEHQAGCLPQAQMAAGWCVAAEDAGTAANAVNAPRLAAQLTRQEAASVFTKEGYLQPEVIANSREIINGTQLGNKQLVSELTSNGSDLADWGKYTTQTFRSPSGPFQVHFYYNSVTGEPFYGLDYKAVFVGSTP